MVILKKKKEVREMRGESHRQRRQIPYGASGGGKTNSSISLWENTTRKNEKNRRNVRSKKAGNNNKPLD